jgi:tRNA1(Val) A37 N6-methylase TrmN6
MFPDATVTDHDAARIGAHLTQRPSVVLMNPPFARNAAGLEDPTQPHAIWLPHWEF